MTSNNKIAFGTGYYYKIPKKMLTTRDYKIPYDQQPKTLSVVEERNFLNLLLNDFSIKKDPRFISKKVFTSNKFPNTTITLTGEKHIVINKIGDKKSNSDDIIIELFPEKTTEDGLKSFYRLVAEKLTTTLLS